MLAILVYFFVIVLELVFAMAFSIYTLCLIYSNSKGAPYVPTKVKEAEFVLREANLRKGQIFYDLGCGDGRIVRIAVQKFGVKGVGIDVNPMLICWARILAKIQNIQSVMFVVQNIRDADIRKADVVYLFLMPKLVRSYKDQLETSLRKGTLVLSHGFSIEGWEHRLFKKISHKPYPTYFYRV